MLVDGSSVVPVDSAGILEIAPGDDPFEVGVLKTINDSLPAFLIREANAVSLEETAAQLASVLTKLTGEEHMTAELGDVAAIEDVGQGELHEDCAYSLLVPHTYDVHETKKGIGLVIVANSGPAYRRRDSKQQELIGTLLNSGLVDKTLMDPNIRSAVLAPGDKIIMPLETKKGPTLHRFDTLYGPRKALATLVSTTPNILLTD